MKDLITVIVNVYNGEKYIKKCLDSILEQTYKNIEILVIDDGSTDKTKNICESYNDKRIKVLKTDHIGLSQSRNVGIDNAKGEFLYFIDVDDFIKKDTLEYLYNLCIIYDSDMSFSKSLEVKDYHYRYKDKKEKTKLIPIKKMLKMNLLSENYAINIWNKLFKRKLFKELRFENRIINDLAFTYKIICTCNKISYGNQIKYFYYRNSDSITMKRKTDFDRNIDIYKVSIDRYNYIDSLFQRFAPNNAGLLRNIVFLYTKQNKKLHQHLDKIGAKELFKNYFSIKILFVNMRVRDKLLIVLFRISPRLYNTILRFYLKAKG